jgi:NADH-quinone oxidoreductase subunit M
MGFVTLGMFMIFLIVQHSGDMKYAALALEGGMVQMISHAFGSGAMFLGFGMIYEQMHTRTIKHYGGVATTMPAFAACYMVFVMSNVGLPGTSGFVGEFMVLLSAFKANFWIAVCAATTLIISAGYTLLMYKRVFYGPVVHDNVKKLVDIGPLEKIIFAMIIVVIIFFGFYPEPMDR